MRDRDELRFLHALRDQLDERIFDLEEQERRNANAAGPITAFMAACDHGSREYGCPDAGFAPVLTAAQWEAFRDSAIACGVSASTLEFPQNADPSIVGWAYGFPVRIGLIASLLCADGTDVGFMFDAMVTA